MKKPSSAPPKPRRPPPWRRPLLLWLLLHAGLPLALLLALALGLTSPSLDTQLLGLLPPSPHGPNMAEADALFAQNHSRNVVVLVSSPHFAQAKEAAAQLYAGLYKHTAPHAAPGAALFEELSLFVDENAVAQLSDFLHEYRYALLDAPTAALLEAGQAQTLADEALAWAYGALHLGGLSHMEEDPFLLSERALRGFLQVALLSGGGLSLKEGVLATEWEGRHYVLLRARLSGEGASLSKGGGIEEIYRVCRELEGATGDLAGAGKAGGEGNNPHGGIGEEAAPPLAFSFSGIPFHSYESASGAQKEITLLSSLTLGLLLLIFLWVFRSPWPVAAIGLSTLLSLAMGLCAALLVFGRVHILALQLGLCLIGLSVDYTLHFFVKRRAALGPAADGALRRGIGVCFVSSFVCFLLFLWAPFAILRQFALFAAVGLLSAYLTTLALLAGGWGLFRLFSKPSSAGPLASSAGPTGVHTSGNPPTGVPPSAVSPSAVSPSGVSPSAAPLAANLRGPLFSPKISKALLAGLALVFIGAIGGGRHGLKIENNLGSLYRPSPQLLASERRASALLGYGAASGFLLGGDSLEELLQREELFLGELEAAGEGGFWGASRLIPSLKTQKARYEAAAHLRGLAKAQYEALGFWGEEAAEFEETYAALHGHYALPSKAPPLLAGLVSNLLVEAPSGRWYSMLLPLGAKAAPGVEQKARLAALAKPHGWVGLQNKAEDISAALDSLTATLLGLLGLAFILVVLGVGIYYGHWPQTLRVAATPVFAGLACLAMHAFWGLPISFFSMTGFILVLGLGLDYVFYFNEDAAMKASLSPGRKATTLAVVLSYATTALSFGALALSSFAPVRLVALSVLSGLSAAFLWAMLGRR